MTTLLERPRSKSAGGTALSGTLPQVNLLPPEVRAARGLRATKRWLVISLVVTLAVCVGAYGLALVTGATAAADLANAQNETARLQTEQAKYAEVPQVLGMLDQTKSARQTGMSTDVQWKSYIDAIQAVLPVDVSLETYAVTVATPMAAAGLPTDPLQAPSVGQIQFTGRSSNIPDAAAWIDALNSVPGFADAAVSSVVVTGDDGGDYYTTTSTVQVLDTAYSHRFDATNGEG
ncbi:fimbrial assembly protein [Cellulomonas sp. Root930]|nr:fimbrial assembly protein [Cellulomonas sp. Root930]